LKKIIFSQHSGTFRLPLNHWKRPQVDNFDLNDSQLQGNEPLNTGVNKEKKRMHPKNYRAFQSNLIHHLYQ